jgi:hypothetical protein
MEPEEIIVNLNVIRQIKKGQKLSTRGAYLDIETPYLVPECIRRWRRQETRNDMINSLNKVINSAIHLNRTDSSILPYIEKAVPGIDNLKQTYSMCHQTCARIDMILDKITKILPSEPEPREPKVEQTTFWSNEDVEC